MRIHRCVGRGREQVVEGRAPDIGRAAHVDALLSNQWAGRRPCSLGALARWRAGRLPLSAALMVMRDETIELTAGRLERCLHAISNGADARL